MIMRTNFYCQNVVGNAEFSIDEWNEQFRLCNELGIEMPLDPDPCKEQCFNCLAIVGKTNIKTQKLIDKLNLNKIETK